MIRKYLSLVKFSHTIFAMPFAMIGFILGIVNMPAASSRLSSDNQVAYLPDNALNLGWEFIFFKFILVLLCMIFARSAAMGFNRWLDKHFDARNPRTAVREIPAGIISADNALRFVILNSLAFVITTWFINPLCFLLSFVALFVVLFYSYTKRFTPLCHLILGVGLALAPIGAYLAVTGVFTVLPLIFSLVVICWVSGFDIIYALQDLEFDRSQSLHSMPVWLGKKNALRVSEILHLIATLLVISAGLYGNFHWLYWVGNLIFAGMLVYQHSIVKADDLSRVNLAFMTANGIASVAFAIFVIGDLILFTNW